MKQELLFGNKNRGVSTLEILIAFAILTLSISAVILVVFGSQSMAVDTQNNIEAVSKAQAELEKVRADARLDFNLVNPKSDPESSGPLEYTKTLAVEPDGFFTKKVTSTVSWPSAGGRTLSVIFSTLVTNPEAVEGGDTCSSVLLGNWKSPQMLFNQELNQLIPNMNSGNGFELSGITVHKKKLYITASALPGSYHDNYTFFVFDLTDPLEPTFSGAGDSVMLSAVTVNGDYAYAAAANSPQLRVIDISNPAAPTFRVARTAAGVTGSQAKGESIFYKDGYVYLGLSAAGSNNGPEFHIFDVQNPLDPIHKGSWPAAGVDFNVGINSILVRDDYAYLAHPQDNINNQQLTVLDISDPSSPQRTSGFYSNGSSGGNGKSLAMVGNKLYLGRTATKLSGTNDALPEFFALNANDPTSMPSTPLASLPLPAIADSINGVSVRDYLAFFITNAQFQVWDMSNAANIVPWTPSGSAAEFTPLPSGKGTSVDCEGNHFYVISESSQGNNKDLLSVITGS